MWGPILASLAGGLFQGMGASRAANVQADAANRQIDFAEQVYNDQVARFAPFLEGGYDANAAMLYEMGLGPRPGGYQGFQGTPGFDFALETGQRAIDGSAAARGNLFSGATLAAQTRLGTGLAQQDYSNHLARLMGLVGVGTGAAGQTATAAGLMGQTTNNALGAIGNAGAAGAVGFGNAVNDGIGNALWAWGYQNPPGGAAAAAGGSFAPMASPFPPSRPW